MRHPCLFLSALCLAASVSSAQTSLLSYFVPPAGATECCAASDTAGNFFVVFSAYNGTSYAVSVLKFGPDLNVAEVISTNLPFLPTVAAVDASHALWLAGFHTLVKLASGSAPLSIELGGADPNGRTIARALVIDPSGNVYITGTTSQSDFPLSPGAFQSFPTAPILPALQFYYAFGFVSKFSNSGTRLLSTLVWGMQAACPDASAGAPICAPAVTTPAAIAIDSSGAVAIAGTTNAADYPVTANAPQPVCKCNEESGDIFLTRLSADFKSLLWSTFLGGTGPYSDIVTETVAGIALEPDGGAVVAGTTLDPDFPVTPGAIEPALPAQAAAATHGFVTRLNAAGTAWAFSTYLGGSDDDSISGMQADTKGNIWIAGSTSSPDFPLLPGSLQLGSTLVLELAADGLRLLVSERIPGGTPSGLWANSDGSFTTSGASVFSSVSGPGTVSEWLLRLPAAPVSGVSLLGVADSAASQTGGAVAPGEFISLYGTGLGPAAGAGAALDSSGLIASQVAGTEVLFDGRAVPLLWASATQINLLAPYGIAGKATTTIEVLTPAGTSQALELTVAPTQPNTFVIVNADGTVNGPNHLAVAGSILTVYAGGAGALNRSLPDGSIASNPAPAPVAPVSIVFPQYYVNLFPGGLAGECPETPERLLYAGGSPGLVVNALQIDFLFQPPQPTYPTLNCRLHSIPQLIVGGGVSSVPLYW